MQLQSYYRLIGVNCGELFEVIAYPSGGSICNYPYMGDIYLTRQYLMVFSQGECFTLRIG